METFKVFLLTYCFSHDSFPHTLRTIKKPCKLDVDVIEWFLANFWAANRDFPDWGTGNIESATQGGARPHQGGITEGHVISTNLFERLF